MEDEELLERLLQFEDVLTLGNPISWLIRQIGWAAIKGMAFLMDSLQGLTESMVGLLGFFNSGPVQDFLELIQPAMYILLAISLAWIAYQMIFNRQKQREHIVINVFISLCVIMGLSTAMSHMDTFTTAANDVVMSDEDGTMADRVIKDNVTDNALYDDFDWTVTNLAEQEVETNNIREDRVRHISLVEEITRDTEISEGEPIGNIGQEILQHKVVTDPSGRMYVAELKNGWLDFFPEQYYRFEINFWTIFVTLFVTSVTLLFTAYKVARLCYEIAFNHVLAVILAYTDINSGQMLKSVLKNIVNMFAIIIMIFLSMRLYTSFMAYLSDVDLNPAATLIAMIAASAAVIDGPKICERVFGIDAGLKSAWGMAAGTYAAAKGGSAAIKAGTKAAGKGASGLIAGAAGAVGAASGLKGGGQGGSGQGPNGTPVQKGMNEQKEGQGKNAGLHDQMSDKGQGNQKGNAQGQQENGQQGSSAAENGKQEPIHEARSNEQGNGEGKGKDKQDVQTPSANNQGQPLHKDMGRQGGQDGSQPNGGKPSIHSDMNKQGVGNAAKGAAGIAGAGAKAQAGTAAGAVGAAHVGANAAGNMAPSGQSSTQSPSANAPETPSTPIHEAQGGPSNAPEGASGPSTPMYDQQGGGTTAPPVSNGMGAVSGQDAPLSGESMGGRTEDIPYQPPQQNQTQSNPQGENRTWGMFASQKGREMIQGTKTYQRSKRSYDLSKNTTSNWKETRANAKRIEAERRRQRQNNKRA